MIDRSVPQPPAPATTAERLAQASALLAQLENLLRDAQLRGPTGMGRLLAQLHQVLDAPPAPARDAALKAAAAQPYWPTCPPWEEPLLIRKKSGRKRAGT